MASHARAAVSPAPPDPFVPEAGHALGRLAYLLVFVIGMVAVGYEIVWDRVIGVLVTDSPYAFASVLAVYLFGVALGSRWVHRFLVRRPGVSHKDMFVTLQFLIGVAALATFAGYYYLTRYTPVEALTRLSFATDLHPSLAPGTWRQGLPAVVGLFLLVDVFAWPMAFKFVPTVFMGASFPLISSLALRRRGGEGAAGGATLGFSVLGNAVGGLITGLVLLPAIGTEMTVLCFGVLGLLFGTAPMTAHGSWLPALPRRAGVLALVILAVVMTCEAGGRMRNFINGQGHGYRPGELFLAEATIGNIGGVSARFPLSRFTEPPLGPPKAGCSEHRTAQTQPSPAPERARAGSPRPFGSA